MVFFEIFRIVCWIVVAFFIIRESVAVVRTFISAREDGIIKTCINPIGAVVSIVAVGLLVGVMYFFFSQASSARNSMEEWKQLRGTEYAEYYKDYYNEMYGNGATQITDFDKYVEQQISAFKRHFNSNTYIGITMAVFALDAFLVGLSKVFYITRSGCFTRVVNKPQEITGEYTGGRIRLYLKEVSKGNNLLIGFKATAENLALLGRFIEQEKEDQSKDKEDMEEREEEEERKKKEEWEDKSEYKEGN